MEETWTDLKLGPEVAVGFSPRLHVATEPQWLVPQADLIFGWDSSASTLVHATLILQRNGPQVRVFASLVSERTGLRQHIDEKVLPWVQRRAPWAGEATHT